MLGDETTSYWEFHDQFRYSPEPEFLGPVLLRWFVAARDGGRGLLVLIETESCELDCHKYLPSPGSVDT